MAMVQQQADVSTESDAPESDHISPNPRYPRYITDNPPEIPSPPGPPNSDIRQPPPPQHQTNPGSGSGPAMRPPQARPRGVSPGSGPAMTPPQARPRGVSPATGSVPAMRPRGVRPGGPRHPPPPGGPRHPPPPGGARHPPPRPMGTDGQNNGPPGADHMRPPHPGAGDMRPPRPRCFIGDPRLHHPHANLSSQAPPYPGAFPFAPPRFAADSDGRRIKNFDIRYRPDDVLVATFPRSGTTWTIEIIRQLHVKQRNITEVEHPLLQIQHKGGIFLTPHASTEYIESVASPRILKTHDYYSDMVEGYLPNKQQQACKVISVIRDLRDVVCSIYEHSKVISAGGSRSLEDFLVGFKEGERYQGPGPGNWWLYTEEYLKNDRHLQILYVQYEALKQRTAETISKINNFLGYRPLSEPELLEVIENTTYDKMKQTHHNVQGSTTGTSGAHKERLSETDVKEFREKTVQFVEKCKMEQLVEGKDVNLERYI